MLPERVAEVVGMATQEMEYLNWVVEVVLQLNVVAGRTTFVAHSPNRRQRYLTNRRHRQLSAPVPESALDLIDSVLDFGEQHELLLRVLLFHPLPSLLHDVSSLPPTSFLVLLRVEEIELCHEGRSLRDPEPNNLLPEVKAVDNLIQLRSLCNPVALISFSSLFPQRANFQQSCRLLRVSKTSMRFLYIA